MKLSELKKILLVHPDAHVRFVLPNGECIPSHAHVTEVARVDKKYIDCGGTFREDSYCRLQTWVADDVDHRLNARKLHGILNKADTLLRSEDLEVDVEHEIGYISQFPLTQADVVDTEVILRLSTRHTACLAPEKCCPPQPQLVSLKK